MAEGKSVLAPAQYERQDVAFPYLAAGLLGTLAALLLSALLNGVIGEDDLLKLVAYIESLGREKQS
jgi:hypothetical protein